MTVLSKTFGWGYFEALRANGAKMGKGSGQVIDDTASGDLLACIGVDYIVNDKIKKGADLPLLLIFAGVIGGMLGFGLIGLFVGPVVLAVTYTLLEAWMADVQGRPVGAETNSAPMAPVEVDQAQQ